MRLCKIDCLLPQRHVGHLRGLAVTEERQGRVNDRGNPG
jgi:hypothetical protein